MLPNCIIGIIKFCIARATKLYLLNLTLDAAKLYFKYYQIKIIKNIYQNNKKYIIFIFVHKFILEFMNKLQKNLFVRRVWRDLHVSLTYCPMKNMYKKCWIIVSLVIKVEIVNLAVPRV